MIAVAMARCTNGEHQLRTILVIPCFMFYLITVFSIFYVLSLDIFVYLTQLSIILFWVQLLYYNYFKS